MPRIRTEILMKSGSEGGRHAPFWENYRPHLVPKSTDNWLGVIAVDLPEQEAVFPATCRMVDFDLIYHPLVDYSDLKVGADFEIREGPRIVGTGRVMEWIERVKLIGQNGLAPCPCCGYATIDAEEDFEICPICFWEDDGQGEADGDDARGPNRASLTAARINFLTYGASDPKDRSHCRAPNDTDEKLRHFALVDGKITEK